MTGLDAVEKQVEAFNARDLDAFVARYTREAVNQGLPIVFDRRGMVSPAAAGERPRSETGIDAIACLDALRADPSLDGQVGLYGHGR